jgi:predicted DNA-binding protein
MLFDPEDGMTMDESIEIALRRRPDLRARMEAVAQSSGRSIRGIVDECMNLFLDDLEDPAKAAAFHAKIDRQEAPFGPDPLVRKNA